MFFLYFYQINATIMSKRNQRLKVRKLLNGNVNYPKEEVLLLNQVLKQ